MLISVIVPVYKAEAFIVRCVESILSQTLPEYELILVDDGSPDSSGAICDEYVKKDGRIRVIHQENGGAAAARNAGLDSASGDWIAFIDSDDIAHPDYLRTLYDAVVDNHADVAACRYLSFSDELELTSYDATYMLSPDTPESYWVGDRTGATVPWGKLYDRCLFDETRFPVGRTGEDEFVTYKILFGCRKLVVVDAPLYYYYTNCEGVSRSDYFKRFPDILACFEEHEEFFKDSPWQDAYRLEVEKYAEAYSNAIWLLKDSREKDGKYLEDLRTTLKNYIRAHKGMIPFEKRKDIYIAAYPKHEIFIRGIGYLKQKANGLFARTDTERTER